MTTSARAVGLIVAGATLWGTTGTAQALGPASASPFGVGVTRLVLGGALLVMLAWRPRPRRRFGGSEASGGPSMADARTTLAAALSRHPWAALAGSVGVVAYQLTFFAAVDRAGVAVGTTVAIGSSPLFTGLIDWVRSGHAPSGRWWLATCIGILGLAGLAGGGSADLQAILLALGAGTSYAVYAIASKHLLEVGLSTLDSMAIVFGGGGILMLPALLITDLQFLREGSGIVMLAWLAVATVMIAYVLFAAGLSTLPAPTVASLSLMEPLTAALLGVVVLGERLGPFQVVGAALLFVALMLLARGASARSAVPRLSA